MRTIVPQDLKYITIMGHTDTVHHRLSVPVRHPSANVDIALRRMTYTNFGQCFKVRCWEMQTGAEMRLPLADLWSRLMSATVGLS